MQYPKESPSSRNGLTYHLLLGKGRCRGYLKEASKARPAKQLLKHDSIAEITLSLNSASASLGVIRLLLVLLGRYRYTFGISEVLSMRVRDVSIFYFMKVYLIMRKNDQYRDGHISVIDNWCQKPTCLVGITEKISSLLPDSSGSSYPIVCRIVNCRRSKERFHKSLILVIHS